MNDSSRDIVFDGDGVRLRIERAPLRLCFEHSELGVVLEQPRGPWRDPQPLPVSFDPEPMGLENFPRPVCDAPFFFEVGEQRLLQWKSEFWAGNLLLGRRSGTVHVATHVIGVEHLGERIRLQAATSDPHRTLTVEVRPDGPGALRVVASASPGDDVTNLGCAFVAGRDEAFHGFGGRHVGVDLRGRAPYGWVEQQNLGNVAKLVAQGAEWIKAGAPEPLAALGYPEDRLDAPDPPGGFE